MNAMDAMDAKKQVGIAAASKARSGMVVGLGTGSTAYHFVVEIARRMREEGLQVQCVSSSFSTSILARDLGIHLLPLEQVDHVDIYADGADEVDPEKRLIKGRGAAMVREKLLVAMTQHFLAIVDSGKKVARLGEKFPVPVEVLPFAWRPAQKALLALGATEAPLRPATGKDGPVVTDQGNVVLDARFPGGFDVAGCDAALNNIPGVVGHGLFTTFAAKTTVLVAGTTGLETLGSPAIVSKG
jgi:ribose 5-phosphate isomerase A